MRTFDLTRLLQQVRDALANPSTNPRMTAAIIAVAAIILVILMVLLWIGLTPRRKRIRKTVTYWIPEGEDAPAGGEEVATAAEMPAAEETASAAKGEPTAGETPEQSEPPSSRRALAMLVGPLLVPLLILAALASAYVATSNQAVCARSCHNGQRSTVTAEAVEHAECAACHEQPLPAGVLENATDRVRMGVRQLQGRPEGVRAVVGAGGCLRCHASDVDGVVTSRVARVRMSHAEPLEAGMNCTECHGAVGHLSEAQPVSMSRCLTCHDSKRASADCSTCHLDDISKAGRRSGSVEAGGPRLDYPLVPLNRRDCGGCHNQRVQCDSCHGLRMPHSTRFLNGYHASQAAFERKQKCWKCHQEAEDCSGCHQVPFAGAHTRTWKADHVKAPSNAQCVCHQDNQPDRPSSMCAYCHGPEAMPSDGSEP